MKTLILAAIRCSVMSTAVTAPLFCVRTAEAYTVRLRQMGANVVAIGSGVINLTELTFIEFGILVTPHIQANFGQMGRLLIPAAVEMGTAGRVEEEVYEFGSTGPTSFGSGDFFSPNTSSGDAFAFYAPTPLFAAGVILAPFGYVSGTALSDSITFNSTTLADLGVTPGTYVWSWGTGLPNQNLTLIIGGARVPDGGSTVSLLACALLGLAALRRKLSC